MMTLQERIAALPRAIVWAGLTILALVAYFFAIEPSLDAINRNGGLADTRLAQLATLKTQLADREEDLRTIAVGKRRHGEVAPLRSMSEANQRAELAIAEVTLDLESIENTNYGKSESAFDTPRSEFAAAFSLTPTQEIVRLRFSISFTATPEDAAEALRRFESSPAFHAVQSVNLRLAGQDERRLSVRFELETWAIADRGTMR